MRKLSIPDTQNHVLEVTSNADDKKAMVLQNGKSKYVREAKSSKSKPQPVAMTPIDPKTVLFFDAIREGSAQKVKSILRGKNMNLNTRDLNDLNAPTALIVACEVNNTDIVRLLLTMKKARFIDVNQEDKVGRRPIWFVYLNV